MWFLVTQSEEEARQRLSGVSGRKSWGEHSAEAAPRGGQPAWSWQQKDVVHDVPVPQEREDAAPSAPQ